MKKNKYTRLFKKISRHDGEVYCGYITPSEILMLYRTGIRLSEFNRKDKPWYEKKVAEGDCSPQWFYFTPSKCMEELTYWQDCVDHKRGEHDSR